MTTAGDILRLVDGFAPFDAAEEWDNAGLLVGSPQAEVNCVLCALDANAAVLREAKERGAQLLLTHHPVMFRGRKNMREDDPEGRTLCEMIRGGISLIAAHTNFDNAMPGVNDALAERLGLRDVRPVDNCMRIGVTDAGTLGAFADFAEHALGGPIRRYGETDRNICRVAVMGGAGGEAWEPARGAGADVYLTGEIHHHMAWNAYESGMCVLEAGHGATELPAVSLLADSLQRAANAIQLDVQVLVSRSELFR